jgi:hypothetical protein
VRNEGSLATLALRAGRRRRIVDLLEEKIFETALFDFPLSFDIPPSLSSLSPVELLLLRIAPSLSSKKPPPSSKSLILLFVFTLRRCGECSDDITLLDGQSASPSSPSAVSPPFFILISTALFDPCNSRLTAQMNRRAFISLFSHSHYPLHPFSTGPMSLVSRFLSNLLPSPLKPPFSSSPPTQPANQKRKGYDDLSGEGCVQSLLSRRVFTDPLLPLSDSPASPSSLSPFDRTGNHCKSAPPPLSFFLSSYLEVAADDKEWKRRKTDLGPLFPPHLDYHQVKDLWRGLAAGGEPRWCTLWSQNLWELAPPEVWEKIQRLAIRDADVAQGRESGHSAEVIKTTQARRIDRYRVAYGTSPLPFPFPR